MEWPWEMVERDHEIQDPTSPEKIRLLGEYLRLTADSQVLDMGCGKAGPAVVLAEAFGCRILGVELREAFAAEARARVKERSLEALIDVRTADAASFDLEPDCYDVAMAIGTCFIWGHIGHAARALAPGVKRGGSLALGEPYWRSEPPEGVDREPFVSPARDGFPPRVSRRPPDRDHRRRPGRLGSLRKPALAGGRGMAGGQPGASRRGGDP
jgi:SAM-dependent methyltransferase